MKRGAIPSPRHILAAAEPHVPLAVIPANHIFLPSRLSVWLNDTDGDCVTAEEAFGKACHEPEIFITDDTVRTWATNHGVLNGANIYQVMQWMQTEGFSQSGHRYDDGKITSVDWTNLAALHSAISQHPVKIGVAADQLEGTVAAPGENGWYGTGYAEDPNEDHCISLCGYGTVAWLFEQLKIPLPPEAGDGSQAGLAAFTWGSIGVLDVPSMLAITQEAWLRSPVTIIR